MNNSLQPDRKSPIFAAILSNEAHVWWFRTDLSENLIQQIRPVRSPDEIAKASRFHFAKDRARSIICQTSLRVLVGAYSGVDPRAICFRRNAYGKPYAASPEAAQKIFFNLSHSGNYAVAATTRRGDIGIDLELMRDSLPYDDLAQRFFAADEKEWLSSLSGQQRLEGFYRLWTIKESLLKGDGAGLSIPLHQVSVRFTQSHEVQVQLATKGRRLWFATELRMFDPAYKAALAIEGSPATIRQFSIDLPDFEPIPIS